MLLLIAIVLIVLVAGLGFAAHVLWWGLILGVIVGIASMFARGRA